MSTVGLLSCSLLEGKWTWYFGKDEDGDQEEPDPQAYLHHPTKAPKTDRDALLKHEVLHNTGDGNAQS